MAFGSCLPVEYLQYTIRCQEISHDDFACVDVQFAIEPRDCDGISLRGLELGAVLQLCLLKYLSWQDTVLKQRWQINFRQALETSM